MMCKLQQMYDRLEASRSELFEQLQALSNAQRSYSPRPGAWSILQVLQHLLLSETQIIHVIRRQLAHPSLPERARSLSRGMPVLMQMTLRLPLRYKVPVKSVIPESALAWEEMVAAWDTHRADLAALLQEFPEEQYARPVFRHAFFGNLTLLRTLHFFFEHFRHHTRQIARIRRSSDFPSS